MNTTGTEASVQECITEANVLITKGELAGAVRMLAQGLRNHPGAPEICANLSTLSLVLGRTDIPEEWIVNGLRHDSTLSKPLIELSTRLFGDNRLAECEGILDALTQGDPDHYEAWNDLGAVRFITGRTAEAEDAFRSALTLHPGYGEAILNLVALCASIGRQDEVVTGARTALEKDCDANSEVLRELAKIVREFSPDVARSLDQQAEKIEPLPAEDERPEGEGEQGDPCRDHGDFSVKPVPAQQAAIKAAAAGVDSAAVPGAAAASPGARASAGAAVADPPANTGSQPVTEDGTDTHSGTDRPAFNPDLNRKAVVWYCTMKCTHRCPYCLAFQVDDPMIKVPFRDYREWVQAWNRFEGELLLDITGGEPFLFPGLVDMINELNPATRVAVTTNAKCDLTRFVQEVTPERCISITASLHPSSTMNTEHFLGKILLLKQRGYRVIVNYVAYPEQLWMIPYFKQMVEGVGIPFHVDPYGPGPKRPFTLSEKEEAFLRRYVGADRTDFFNKEETLYQCSGGMNFFSTLPNGDTYTCVTKRYVKENFVGNLFDDDFKPYDEAIRCKAVSCAGCDLDKVTRISAPKPCTVEGEPS